MRATVTSKPDAVSCASAAETSGRGKIKLLVNDPVRAKRALRKAKYRASEEPAFALRLRNKPGALARLTARLAKERINVRSIYATTAGRGSAMVVLTVGGNAGKARRVLGRGSGRRGVCSRLNWGGAVEGDSYAQDSSQSDSGWISHDHAEPDDPAGGEGD